MVVIQYGVTALIWTSGKGQTAVVELLIKHGADVNAKAEVRNV